MKRLAVWLAAICSLLIATQARAVPIEFVFQGAINQTVFDPFDPFGGAIDFGTPFSGKYFFNSMAPDAIPGDPQTGSYTSTGAPYGMTVNIGGITFTAGDFLNIGVATNLGGVDQYTVLAQRGTPGGLSDFLTLSLFFRGTPGYSPTIRFL